MVFFLQYLQIKITSRSKTTNAIKQKIPVGLIAILTAEEDAPTIKLPSPHKLFFAFHFCHPSFITYQGPTYVQSVEAIT